MPWAPTTSRLSYCAGLDSAAAGCNPDHGRPRHPECRGSKQLAPPEAAVSAALRTLGVERRKCRSTSTHDTAAIVMLAAHLARKRCWMQRNHDGEGERVPQVHGLGKVSDPALPRHGEHRVQRAASGLHEPVNQHHGGDRDDGNAQRSLFHGIATTTKRRLMRAT